MSILQIRKLRLRVTCPGALIQKGWDIIRAMSHPMEILALRPGEQGSRKTRESGRGFPWGPDQESPCLYAWNSRGLRLRELGGRRSACPSPSLPFTGAKHSFPQKPSQHFNSPMHWLSVSHLLGGLTIIHRSWTTGHFPGFSSTDESRDMG